MGVVAKIIILTLVAGFALLLNLLLGSVSVSLETIFDLLLGNEVKKSDEAVILLFRMPKILAASIAGASLGVSGLLMQTFFRNPIAGPFVLGISSGASLGVALFILAGGWLFSFPFFACLLNNNAGIIVMAMLGASSVLVLLMLVSWRIRDINTLLIIGLMMGSATSAIVAFLQYFSSQQALQQFVLWSMGSLTGVTWEELQWLFPVCTVALIISFGLSKTLDILLLGDQYALSMGIHIRRAQQAIILITAILAGSITAFCGPIAFVGIAVPHLARMLFQTHRHLILLIGCILLGVITLLFCQFIAQLPGSEKMLPINVVTSFLGAPMVIYIILSKRTV